MSIYLAVDAGGTKTAMLLANETGQILARSQAGPANLGSVTPAEAVANFEQALADLVTQASLPELRLIDQAVIGMAGVDTDLEQAQAQALLKPVLQKFHCLKYQVINDAWIALASGTDNPAAVVLIAGTGSNCLGRNSLGAQAKAGGWGHLLSDQGSGYALGLAVLKAAAQSYDGSGPKTNLEDLLMEHLQIFSWPELKAKIYQPVLRKRQIAQLAPLLDQAIAQQDPVAIEIIDQAQLDLVNLVKTVVEDLALNQQIFDLVIVGGLVKQANFREQLSQLLTEQYPQVKIIYPNDSPVFGALKLILQS